MEEINQTVGILCVPDYRSLSVVIQLRSGLFFANNNIVDIMRSMIVPCIYALCAFFCIYQYRTGCVIPVGCCAEQLSCDYG